MRILTAKLLLLAIALAALPAHAQIAFRAAASATAAGITPAFRAASSAATTGATLTITKPSGTATNDVLVASIAVAPSSVAISPPSGWMLVRRLDNAGPTSNSLAVYYKVATAGEPASYAWGVSGANFAVGGVQGFTGINTASPIDVESGQSTPSATSHAAPAVTSTVTNTMLVASHAFASSRTWTPPSGMTESFDRPSGANSATGLSVEGSRVLLGAAGSSGTKTASAAGDADTGNAHLLALRPANANLAIPTPAGTAAGDVMIAAIGFNNAGAAITPPSGWTLVRRVDNTAATSNSLAVYRKTAAAGEPASHVWGVAGGVFLVGGIQSFSGVDTANPIDAESGQSTPSSMNHDTPSITTSTANTMLVAAHTYASSQSWSPQSGLTESFDRPSGSTGATGQSITGTRQAQAGAGASGTKRSTASSSADVGNTHILALRRLPPNAPPTVSLTSPVQGATFVQPANINLTATANDSDGTISRVEFYGVDEEGNRYLIASVAQPPYSANWTSAQPIYQVESGFLLPNWVEAVAFDNHGASSTRQSVEVYVGPPLAITSPLQGATYTAPATIPLEANAGSPYSEVTFYSGTSLITSNPWQNVGPGTYSLTAKATIVGAYSVVVFTSPPVTVTVASAEKKLHFIHVDHLNTPRLVANQSGQTVWRWDQQEPFGVTVPDENPSGLGAFEFPLRFDGTYADRETNLFENWHRMLDPSRGQYLQSDPIGLQGGLNTYSYVLSNPLSFVDPTGLQVILPGGGAIGGGLPGAGGIVAPGGGIKPNRPGDGPLGDVQAPGKPTWPFPSSGAEADRDSGQSAGRLAPPGKCTPTQHRRLQDEVNAACKIPRRCDPSQDCPQLLDNYYKNLRCAQARDEINNTCFAGGDAGHRQAANDARNAANRCIVIMQQKGCANCPVPPNK